ncbi:MULTISPECIES: alcohol acetyltransferase [Bacillus]|uniref:alcohol acetyltransferase n=1 Tax=Bacillus TaxID=1386 RepID=UPI0009940679|nr:alcohol acetyltransferase [Bacillus cereus]OOQ97701.1 alcohol acetyltransferase [Bacillus cereus]
MNVEWYKLDNAGKLYASTVTSRVSMVFRLSVNLKSMVNPEVLQWAIEQTLEQLPLFKVIVKKGIFWNYFKKTNEIPIASIEHYYPCSNLFFTSHNTFPYRILYYNRRISFEVSHMLTDGTGALEFLKLLVTYYVMRKESLDLQMEMKNSINLEFEDSFATYYEENVPSWQEGLDYAYKLPFKFDKKGIYHITTGEIDIREIKQLAKSQGISITTYLISKYIEVLIEIQDELAAKPKPITINIPVNLRNFFESQTLRNFFVSIPITIDPRLGEYTFHEIVQKVQIEFKRYLNSKQLKPLIARNVRGERNVLLRLLPLTIKDQLAPIIHSKFGESLYTSSISNLGVVSLNKDIEPFIERFEFYPPPSVGNKIKAGVISYGSYMYITFGNISDIQIVEREFFRKLKKDGINVKIESNRRGY